MTAEERIDELDAETIRGVLARIIRIVEAGGTMANVAAALNGWSLIEADGVAPTGSEVGR